jgi:hypothetical protein
VNDFTGGRDNRRRPVSGSEAAPWPRPDRETPMSFDDAADLLWYRSWWKYANAGDPWFSIPYHAFNLFEGVCWVVIGALVFRRYLAFRRSSLEIVYALAFLSFGLTDFREAYVLQSWLVWVKLANLIALICLRAAAIKRWYPGTKLF